MMLPHQRPRTGQRRDDGVRVIRTDDIRYPGADHPLIDRIAEDNSADEARSGTGRFIPARDTGLALEGRAARLERHKARTRRRTVAIIVGVAIALLAGALGWRYTSDQRAAGMPLTADSGPGASTAGASPVAAHAQYRSIGDLFRSASRPKTPPTPIFAAYRGLKLRLPVPVARLTELGFHQAAYPYALRMTTPLPDAKLSEAGNRQGTGRDATSQPTGEDAVLVGKVLRMWRPRPGRPDTAADVGGRPGTKVYSPVTGTVVKIKTYKLYGKWSDFEVHIRPDGYPQVDLVMIHVTDLTVKQGARVEAGVTQVASIRKLSDKVNEQLADYMKGGGGDHVHMQLNNANDPTYKGLKGAIDPEPMETTQTGGSN